MKNFNTLTVVVTTILFTVTNSIIENLAIVEPHFTKAPKIIFFLSIVAVLYNYIVSQ